MSDIRFNNWLHQSGTGGVYQDGSGNVGIGTSVPSATLDVEGTINANTAVISGNLTVEGVLTYDDVTNIDSVGIITARDGLQVTGGNVGINSTVPGEKLDVLGTIRASAGTNQYMHMYPVAGAGYFDVRNQTSYPSIVFRQIGSGGTQERLRITSTGEVRVPDGGKFTTGDGDDLQVYHDGTDTWIDNDEGDLYIRNTGDDIIIRAADDVLIQTQASEGAIIARGDGQVELYYNNDIKLETTSSGAKVTGVLQVTQEYPTIRPTLDLNFAVTKVLDDRITFTRDGVGTYIDEDGLIKYASSNVPRFDHDPTTGESLGLLIEESRTNYQDYSVDINTGKNHFTGSTLTANAATAPDGTTTATRITGSGTDEGARLGWDTQITSNTQYNVFSVFVKAGSGTPILGFYSNTFVASNVAFNVDLSDGTTNVINNNSGFFSKVVAYPNGWYRVSVMGGPGTGSGGSWNINLVPSLTSARGAQSGSNASASYLIWGVQEELASSPFPTSYIPTSGSTVTRGQDFAKITGTNFTDFYNQAEGTLVCDQSISDLTTANQYSVILSSNVNESIGMGYRVGGGASGNYGFYIIKSGDALFRNVTGVVSADTPIRTALAYKLNDGATVVNGESAVNDTSLVLPTPDRMLIGEGYSTNNEIRKGHIRKISYYNKRLPNAQLQGLTQQ